MRTKISGISVFYQTEAILPCFYLNGVTFLKKYGLGFVRYNFYYVKIKDEVV